MRLGPIGLVQQHKDVHDEELAIDFIIDRITKECTKTTNTTNLVVFRVYVMRLTSRSRVLWL
jgi:hypothetical protein